MYRRIFEKLLSVFRGSERELIERLVKHVELSIQALERIISEECVRNASSCVKVIGELEKKGDDIAREIHELISRSALSVPVFTIIEILVHKIDDILDEINILARELDRLLRFSTDSDLTGRVYEYVCKSGRIALDSLKLLRNLLDNLFSKDISNLRGIVSRIEHLEEEVDELKNVMLEFVYSRSKSMSNVEFYASMFITYTLDNVLDRVKDAAELMLILVLALS